MPSSRYLFGVLPWYSVLIVCGICAALLWCSREEKRLGLPADTTVDLALWTVPLGVVGARLYYVAFSWDMFRDDLISILEVWHGGLAIYGAILGGVLAVALFAWRKKLPFLTLADMIVPGLALAQAIGRWGNFFNMEAYGLPVTNPAWQFFPFAVLIPEGSGQVWHMATFFYESLWDLGVFVTLARMRKHLRRPGDTLLWYLLLYGGGRLVIEGLRMDSLMTTGGSVRVSQMLSVCLCLVVLAIFAARMIGRPRGRQWLTGGLGLLAGIALLLLPTPAESFWGARTAWAALWLISLTALGLGLGGSLSLRRRVLTLVPLVLLAGSAAVSAAFAVRGIGGAEMSMALCLCFSAAVIAAAAWFYPEPMSRGDAQAQASAGK